MSTWREDAAPIIADVIRKTGRDDMKALRRALRESYPFGVRAYHPYKIWLSEIKRQLFPSPPKIKEPVDDKTIDMFKG